MAFFLALGVACLVILLAARAASGQPERAAVDEGPGGAPYVAGELIVVYEDDASAREAPVRGLLQSVEGTVEEDFSFIDSQLLDFPEIKREGSREERERLLEETKRELEAAPNVESVDYNYVREFFARPNDRFFERQWHLPVISAPRAWNTQGGDAGTRISVIDSGIDLDHPDLTGKIAASTNTTTDGGNANDTDGHGTHVAGIAAADTNNGAGVAGVCPECRLLVAKAGSQEGILEGAAIIEAIEWSIANDADVINMSFGGEGEIEAERDAVARAWEAGVTLVAAAGNTNTSVRNYPAAYENVIAVSATTRQDAKAGYSNFGPWIDVAAPGGANANGRRVYSTVPGRYGGKVGTSMASPVVAGVAGLLSSQGLDNARATARMQSTAEDLGPAGRDDTFGYGRVDAANAVGIDATENDENTPPRIANLYPRPTSRLGTNVATIRAIVRDSETELQRKDVRLVVDGRRVNFTYDAANDRLTKRITLAPGRHRARIIATDEEGVKTRKEWGFVTSAP